MLLLKLDKWKKNRGIYVKKILIVDDEMIVIEGILSNIHFEDYGIQEVETANSLEQAQVIIQRGGVDIVMCDIEMPNGSGLDLFAWINTYDSNIVKLILTCHTEFYFAQQAINLMCMQYIIKPVTSDVLKKAVNIAVEQVKKRNNELEIRKFGEEYINRLAGIKGDEVSAVDKVHQYITKHIEEDISVEKLAKNVYLSQNHLARVFKKKYGKTIVEYIIEYRLNLAKEMLKNTNLTVTTISAKIGYSNYAYFTKLFKKHCGYTPSAYRNQFSH